MKKWLKCLILLTFFDFGRLKALFLQHEEDSCAFIGSIYSRFSSFLQQEIRLPC